MLGVREVFAHSSLPWQELEFNLRFKVLYHTNLKSIVENLVDRYHISRTVLRLDFILGEQRYGSPHSDARASHWRISERRNYIQYQTYNRGYSWAWCYIPSVRYQRSSMAAYTYSGWLWKGIMSYFIHLYDSYHITIGVDWIYGTPLTSIFTLYFCVYDYTYTRATFYYVFKLHLFCWRSENGTPLDKP